MILDESTAQKLDILLAHLVGEEMINDPEAVTQAMGVDELAYRRYFQKLIDEDLAYSKYNNLLPLLPTVNASPFKNRGGFAAKLAKDELQQETQQLIQRLTIRQLKSVVFVGRFGLGLTLISVFAALVSLLITVLVNWSAIVAFLQTY